MSDIKSIPPLKSVWEYQLPAARKTEEVICVRYSIGDFETLLITQQDASRLLKVKLDAQNTGKAISVQSFTISSIFSGLRGLVSSRLPGYGSCVWATLQFENALVLLDVFSKDDEVTMKKKIELPTSVSGPQHLHEAFWSRDECYLWITCRYSGHVVRFDTRRDHFDVYRCEGKPNSAVGSSLSASAFYATCADNESQILSCSEGKLNWIDIPPFKGRRPLGLTTAPDNSIWFVLAIGASIGRIDEGFRGSSRTITWFDLPAAEPPLGPNLGFLRVAFDEAVRRSYDDPLYNICILSSSLVSDECADAVLKVTIRDEELVRRDTVLLATQGSRATGISCFDSNVYVTESSESVLAHLRGDALTTLHFENVHSIPYIAPHEACDADELWGLGEFALALEYIHND